MVKRGAGDHLHVEDLVNVALVDRLRVFHLARVRLAQIIHRGISLNPSNLLDPTKPKITDDSSYCCIVVVMRTLKKRA